MNTKLSKGLLTAVLVLALVLPGFPILAVELAGMEHILTSTRAEPLADRLASDVQELNEAVVMQERPPFLGTEWWELLATPKFQAGQSQNRGAEFLDVEEGGQLHYDQPEFEGYIIQFQEKPVVLRESELRNELEANRMTTSQMKAELSLYQSKLESTFQTRKAKLRRIIPDFDARIRDEFTDVFHGISLDISEKEAIEIKKLDFVTEVYPNYKVAVSLQDSLPLINATSAWDLGYTGSGAVIAIVDTGIDYTHSDLGECLAIGPECKVIGGWDFVNDDSDPMDDDGHGTHVAGIAAAKGDADGNNIYEPEAGDVWGVAPDAQLLAYKVLDASGQGPSDQVIAGIEQAVSDGADVINLSLGGWGNPDDPLSQAVDNAVGAGVVVVVAAGNYGPDGRTIDSPGTARKAVTVGASDKSDDLAQFSARGPVIWDNKSLVKPDLVAPGVSITAPVPEFVDPSGYQTWSGTSMSTPHVAGAAALLLQKNPTWTPLEVKMALRNTAVDLPDEAGLFFSQGHGRLDVAEAVALNLAQPIAELVDIPYEVSGTIDIMGTAGSTGFESYALYCSAEYPSETWAKIMDSTASVEEGLLASWDTSLVADGECLLKLEVKDTGDQISTDVGLVLVNNVALTHPLNNDVFRAGDTIAIEGTIQGTNFQNYVVQFGLGENPSEWFTTGMNLIDNGQSQIISDVLAAWDTSSVTSADYYTLRLTANFSAETYYEYIRNIYLDPTLRQGWPKRIEWDYSSEFSGYFEPGFVAPVVADLDNNGQKEIITHRRGYNSEIYIWDNQGNLLNTIEVEESWILSPGALAVADIDDDGEEEILAIGYPIFYGPPSKILAYRKDGTLIAGFPVEVDGWNLWNSLVVSDLDSDGQKEIIATANTGDAVRLTVVGSDAQIISQLDLNPVYWGASVESTPAVGNFDDDQELEIVVAIPSENAGYDWEAEEWINEGLVYVCNMDGTVVDGWPVLLSGVPFSSPAVGDTNNDGNLEIVLGLLYTSDIFPDDRYGGLYALDKSGDILPGWPFMKGYSFWSSPSLADFNGDGYLEIGASMLDFETYILRYDGTPVTGWPQTKGWADYYSTIVGDVDGDGVPDILTTAGSGFVPGDLGNGGVYAWRFDGSLIGGFPKITEIDAQAPATIADIDNDGKVELIASSNSDYDWINEEFKRRSTVYVWELGQDYNGQTMEWPTFHHDPQRTGLYGATALAIMAELPDGQVGVAYSANLEASGGVTPYNWTIIDGMLPDGLTLDSEAGVISGTPTKTGTFDFTIEVTDAVGYTATSDLSITIVETVELELSLKAGWNMVSVPVIPADDAVSAVFPGVAGIFTWNATSRNYYVPTIIEPDRAYWVAVTEDTTIIVCGIPIETRTIDITAGWNMIGSVNTTVSIADPNDDPDESIIPPAYWWDPVSKSYITTTDIEPGKGYWVASLNDCTLTL
jgi:subtilisin family serine protease